LIGRNYPAEMGDYRTTCALSMPAILAGIASGIDADVIEIAGRSERI